MTPHPMFWTVEDFDDPFARLAGALEEMEMERAEPVRMYDLMGAERPEDAQLPMSYWSKQRILFLVRESEELRPAAELLERMKLEDLRAVALVETGTMATGRVRDWGSKEWRHTKFHSLNVEWIGALAKDVAKAGL